MLWRPVNGPPLGRDRKGLLGGFLGEVQVAEETDKGSQDPPPVAPEDLLDQKASSVGISTNGRISTAPPSLIAGMRWAKFKASSRFSASST